MNTPWKYIKLSQLMASVKADLHNYDDSSLIDDDDMVKIVAECNEKLGQRIYKSRECKIKVVNFKAEFPSDLYKIENIFATKTMNIVNTNPQFGARQLEFSDKPPCDTDKMITYGKMGCTDSNNNCFFVSDRRNDNHSHTEIVYETIVPLSLTSRLSDKCMEYAPCNSRKGEFKADIDQEEFTFSFETGEIYMCYLGNLIDEDGDIQIPFHPLLNSYYEYAIKEKLLEDVFLNSEDDVIKKLQYISQKRKDAYAIAWNFANSKQVNEWNKIQKKLKVEYYDKWYRMYN